MGAQRNLQFNAINLGVLAPVSHVQFRHTEWEQRERESREWNSGRMAEKKIRQVEILGGVSEAAVEDGIQIHNLEWRGDSWSHRVVLLLRLLLSWLLKAEYIGNGKHWVYS